MATRFERVYFEIKKEIELIKDGNNYSNESEAFGHYMLKAILGIDDDEANKALVDGKNDNGIDAIYFDERSEKITTHFFQFKFPILENIESGVKRDDVLKLIDGYISFSGNDSKFESRAWNDAIIEKRNYFKNISDSNSHFLYIVKYCTNNNSENIDIFKNKIEDVKNNTGNDIEQKCYFAKEICTLFDKINKTSWPNFSIKFKKDLTTYEDQIAKVSSFYVSLYSIYEGLKGCNNSSLYEGNVRYFDNSSTVNKTILETLSSPDECKKFHLLNNGITIVCTKSVKNNTTETIQITSGSIINGAQTVGCILKKIGEEEEKKNSIEYFKNSFVFIRVIEVENKQDLVDELVLTLNTQNPMNSSYSISNDSIIKRTQSEINKKTKYFLQIKSNEYKFLKMQNPSFPKKQKDVIDIESGIQAFVSYENIENLAHLCKTNKAALFAKENREKIINCLDYNKLILSNNCLNNIMAIIREYRAYRKDDTKKDIISSLSIKEDEIDNYRFLNTGNYLILFSLGLYCRQRSISVPGKKDIVYVIKQLCSLFPKDESNISNITRKKETYEKAFTIFQNEENS